MNWEEKFNKLIRKTEKLVEQNRKIQQENELLEKELNYNSFKRLPVKE